jgi:hypothetical protein
MREYRQDVLSTVHWALGGVVTLAVVLIGYTGFFANRNYERDKASMRIDLKRDVEAEARSLRELLDANARAHRDDLGRLATVAASSAVQEAAEKLNRLSYELREVRREVLAHKRDTALRHKDGRVALNAIIESWPIRRDHLSDIVLPLDIEALSNLLHQEWFTHLGADQAAELMALLNSVGPEHAADVDAIRTRVRRLRARGPEASE